MAEPLPDIVFRNVRVLDPSRGEDAVRDLAVAGGRFAPASAALAAGAPAVDASGLAAAPGLRDVHVHFRDPGVPAAETTATGAAAAAAGGFTCVTVMPNTSPAGDSPEWVRSQAAAQVPVRIAPSACITAGRAGRAPAALEELAAAGAVAFTDDGSYVADAAVMREAMLRAAALGRPVMQHAVDPVLLAGGVIRDCPAARRFSLPAMPPEAETEAVRRDIALCRETGCALHVQHVSCAGTVELLRAAQAEGLPVTGEATPHHLFFCAGDIPADDAAWKMAPPLGSAADREALRAAVAEGVLSMFATDHAPHPAASKLGGFAKGANGIVGLETALAATWTAMVLSCGMAPLDWAARWTSAPARLIGDPPPSLADGAPADFTVFDPSAEWTVDPDRFMSMSRNTPFAGVALRARPLLTVCNGRITHGSAFLR